MSELRVELDGLTPAERRDLANALLRAAWCAVLEETRILLLDLLVDVGTYTSPVAGLNDIGDQLCAPPGPGDIVTVSLF